MNSVARTAETAVIVADTDHSVSLLLAAAPHPLRCPVTAYLSTLQTKRSRDSMLSSLRRAMRVITGASHADQPYLDPRLLNWSVITHTIVARMQQKMLEDGEHPKTIAHTRTAVAQVAGAAFDLELISSDALLRIQRVKRPKGQRVTTGRCLTPGEIRALFEVCGAEGDHAATGLRDAALLAVAIGCGLRREELSTLDVSAWSPGSDRDELVVLGKGNKQRRLWLTNGARDAVRDWLDLRGHTAGRLFVAVNKGGRMRLDCGMSGQSIDAVVRKRFEQAGIASFTPHDCRRTFATGLLDAGVDIATVAKLMGHASIETTRIYDRRGDRAAAAATDHVHIPYVRRAA